MSVKKMLNEWRNFLSEAPEFDEEMTLGSEYEGPAGQDFGEEIGTGLTEPERDDVPLDRDHLEGVKEIETFLTTDLRCDVSSEEYASFVSCLSRSENADTVAKLVEIVRKCVSGF